jgi:hypothetical protein
MNGIETASPEKNTLPILLDGRPACRVEPSGCVCIFPDDLRSAEADELYHKVAPFSEMVKEYMTAIERAPLLKATAPASSKRNSFFTTISYLTSTKEAGCSPSPVSRIRLRTSSLT